MTPHLPLLSKGKGKSVTRPGTRRFRLFGESRNGDARGRAPDASQSLGSYGFVFVTVPRPQIQDAEPGRGYAVSPHQGSRSILVPATIRSVPDDAGRVLRMCWECWDTGMLDGPHVRVDNTCWETLNECNSMRRVARLLALFTALVLAFPPCWCCVARRAAETEAAPSEKSPQPSSCCCHVPPPILPEQDRPEETPIPCKSCCCCQQHAVQPKSPEAAAPEAAVAPLALTGVPQVVPVAVSVSGDLTLHDSSPPVRVRNCIWLC